MNGRNLNYAGRLTLVKSVLTSQVVYFLMAVQAPKAVLKDIDARRKQFLWAGTERITGAKCKVNWTRAARTKKNGGLGILHLGKFARALHLRRLCHEWNLEGKSWVGDELSCNKTNKHLLAAATTIKFGNRRKISFWNSASAQGLRPRDLAPSVYIISKKKNITLQEALVANTRIKDLDLLHPSFSMQLFYRIFAALESSPTGESQTHNQVEIC